MSNFFGGSGAVLARALDSDHTNSTATPTDLTGLTVEVAVGGEYVFDMVLMCSQSVAADGVRVDFGGGTGAPLYFHANVLIYDGTVIDTNTTVSSPATDVTSANVGTTVLIRASGYMVMSSSGTFIPRIGLSSATTGTITTARGSYMLVGTVSG